MGFKYGVVGALCALALNLPVISAGYPPRVENMQVVESKKFPGVSISYKQISICETTEGVKSYSGYVNLPPNEAAGRSYESHIYFIFFGARKNATSAPLTMWLQGGPGSPSMSAALGENGPCRVNDDSKTTTLQPYSWNDQMNMLYIDQPVAVGFSYHKLMNGTINQPASPFIITPANAPGSPTPNSTVVEGTFYDTDAKVLPKSTLAFAPAIWEMLQTFLQEFPGLTVKNNKLNLWGESYGGHYIPTYTDYIRRKNDEIKAGTLKTPGAVEINVETIGLLNVCADLETQLPSSPDFAVNNTFGIKAYNETVYQAVKAAMPMCLNMTRTCRELDAKLDPKGWGNNTEVNKACADAFGFCMNKVHEGPFKLSGLYHFDMSSSIIGDFPPKFAAGWMNTPEVQQALGVPLNFTGSSYPIAVNYLYMGGDFVKGHNLEILGNLVDSGVNVALVYGDLDYQCNWFGGEKLSLAIKSKASAGFSKAQYANVVTSKDGTVGGMVRQYGSLSFVRVFKAGHESPWYQPEISLDIFNRVSYLKDVATGKVAAISAALAGGNGSSVYSSTGVDSTLNITAEPPKQPTPRCYWWDIMETCNAVQTAQIKNGTAIFRDYLMVGVKDASGTETLYNGTAPPPAGGSPPAKPAAAAGFRPAALTVLGVALVAVFIS